MSKKSLRSRDQGDWIIVAYAMGIEEAEIVAGLLRSFEIPVFIQQEALGRAFGLTFGALGAIRLLVPARFEQAALALLEDDEDDPSTLLDEPPIIFPDDKTNDYED